MTYLYFLAGLLASGALVLALFIILVSLLRNNWNHANKHAISYLAPLVLVLGIVYFSLTEFIPRALDLVAVASRQYGVTEIDLEEVKRGRSSLIADGTSYYFVPGTFGKKEDGRYQLMYTPGTRFVIHISPLGDSLDK